MKSWLVYIQTIVPGAENILRPLFTFKFFGFTETPHRPLSHPEIIEPSWGSF